LSFQQVSNCHFAFFVKSLLFVLSVHFFEPLQVSSYYNKGSKCIELGQDQSAIEDYNETIRLKSDYAEAYNNRAHVYLSQGDNISGCRDARNVCKLGIVNFLENAKQSGVCR
jgi:tetratricopeptide (TPR) repeat protein